ncbi:MAG: IclR family transcriptional regulator [Alicyclobacillus sp.]|nr:IclR family transcriptional regulator [Alicyclobacillus sp.]
MTDGERVADAGAGTDADERDVDERYVANALVRGLQIIRCFDRDHPTLSLVEIAERLGVSRSVPYRLVYTLEVMGYVAQDKVTKRYHLTPKVMELGYAYLQSLQVPEVAEPILRDLRDVTGCSAHLGVLSDNSVVYIARVPARSVTSVGVHIGARLPAHATAMGKVLLAYQPEWETSQRLSEQALAHYTANTKVRLQDLLLEFRRIRDTGYAISNEEFEYGIFSVAMPILDAAERAVAAVNVAAIPQSMTEPFLHEVVLPALSEAAEKLSTFFRNGGRSEIFL